MKYIIKILLLLFLSLSVIQAKNPQGRIKGKIVDENDRPMEYVNVTLKGLEKGTFSKEDGTFELFCDAGNQTLLFQFVGYTSVEKNIVVTRDKTISLGEVKLKPSSVSLNEVVVSGESVVHKLSTAPIKADIIDTKEYQYRPIAITEMMNQTVGVRIRQSGGVGSFTNVMLNGFQGSSIRIFKDGIPLDYLQGGIELNNIPVNVLSRVEIYKGVLPAYLSADALGGAVNLVSKERESRQVAVSYEIASFNTHRVTLNASATSTDKKFFGGVDAFANYSDNNYKVMAPVVDEMTANVTYIRLPLFHNAYKHFYSDFYAGIQNTGWADELRLSMSLFSIVREDQFASLMEKPYGAVLSKRHASLIPSLHYRKRIGKKTNIDQFVSYSEIWTEQIDTLRGGYDWYGVYKPPVDDNTIGESQARLSKIKSKNFVSRSNLAYTFNENHSLALNVVIQSSSSKGHDPYGTITKDSEGNELDLLSLPSDYTKLISSMGYQSELWGKRITHNSQFKYYMSRSSGRTVNLTTGRLNDEVLKNQTHHLGAATAFKLKVNSSSFARLSVEYATRLPEQQEVFGDARFTLSNFNLKPERSANLNLGYRLEQENNYSFEFNGFYRITKDLITNELKGLIYSQNTNIDQVKGLGVELDARVSILTWLRAYGNATYQNFRLFHLKDQSIKYLEGARLPNIPFCFANLGLNAAINRLFTSNDALEIFYRYSYVHKYYLRYIPKDAELSGFLGLFGESKINTTDIIPGQNLHSIGFTWTPSTKRNLILGGEVKNLFDTAVYDNFRIQNAGRSFHLKISYSL